MLARATGTENQRSASLDCSLRLFAESSVLERASFGASFRSASASLPARCMFVVIPVDLLRPASCARGIYTQGEQSSSGERMWLISRARGTGFETLLADFMSCLPVLRLRLKCAADRLNAF